MGGRFQLASALRSDSQISFVAAWSFGKWAFFRTLRRTVLLRLSIAFVVSTIRRTSAENAKNGITAIQLRRQLAAMFGYFWPAPR